MSVVQQLHPKASHAILGGRKSRWCLPGPLDCFYGYHVPIARMTHSKFLAGFNHVLSLGNITESVEDAGEAYYTSLRNSETVEPVFYCFFQ